MSEAPTADIAGELLPRLWKLLLTRKLTAFSIDCEMQSGAKTGIRQAAGDVIFTVTIYWPYFVDNDPAKWRYEDYTLGFLATERDLWDAQFREALKDLDKWLKEKEAEGKPHRTGQVEPERKMNEQGLEMFDELARNKVATVAKTNSVWGLLHRRSSYNHGGECVQWRRRDRQVFTLFWKRHASPVSLWTVGSWTEETVQSASGLVDAVLSGIIEEFVMTLTKIGGIAPLPARPDERRSIRLPKEWCWNQPTDYGSGHWQTDQHLRPAPLTICHDLPHAWASPNDPLDIACGNSHADFFLMAPCNKDHPWKTWAAEKEIAVGESPFVPPGAGFMFAEKALDLRFMQSQPVTFDCENGGLRAEAYFATVFCDPCDVVILVPTTKFETLAAR